LVRFDIFVVVVVVVDIWMGCGGINWTELAQDKYR
jgi:hypothetical protein